MAAARDARADPAAIGDRRVLFFGDSFVAGVGDPTGLGWVGRVVAASHAAGADVLNGEGNNDTLNGGTENDNLNGGTGKDIIRGDAGNDRLTGLPNDGSSDTVDGGANSDVCAREGLLLPLFNRDVLTSCND